MAKLKDIESLLMREDHQTVPSHGTKLPFEFPQAPEFKHMMRDEKPLMRAMGIEWEKTKRGWILGSRKSSGELLNCVRSYKMSWNTSSEFEPPAPDGKEYLPFQKAGIEYALKRRNTLFGDEMGLGKTIQAIGVANCTPGIKRIIIVCPAYLKNNWAREMREWAVMPVSIQIPESPRKSRTKKPGAISHDTYTGEGVDVTIVNYENLKKFEWMKEIEWDLMIVDEAHYIKSSKAQRTKAVMAINAKRKLALTGTPLLNRPIELHSLTKFAMGNDFMSDWDFKQFFCGAVKTRHGTDYKGSSNEGVLKFMTRSNFMVRRLKADVLKDLPPKMRKIVELPKTEEVEMVLDEESSLWSVHQKVIDELRLKRVYAELAMDDDEYCRIGKQLAKQLAIGFAEMAELRKRLALLKVPILVPHVTDMLENECDKLIVFFHHKEPARELAEKCAQFNPIQIDGDVPSMDRQALVDRFQNDPGTKLAVLTIGAGGTGYTLTAASNVIMAELDWRPGIMAQAEDRAHRIGQHDSVLVEYTLFPESLDAKMIDGVINKLKTIKAVIDSRDDGVKSDIIKPKKAARDWKADGALLNGEQRQFIKDSIALLAHYDKDMASVKNGLGFNKFDSVIGHEFASKPDLSMAELGYAKHFMFKYRNQLSLTAQRVIWPEKCA